MIRWISIALAASVSVNVCTAQTLRLADRSVAAGIQTPELGIGVSAFDFDRDGWDDITIALQNRAPALFRNNQDGTFTDVSEQTGIQGEGNLVIPIWADINNDGHSDLFIGHRLEGKNALWLNNGDDTFSDVTDQFGIVSDLSLGSAAFGDFDADGYVDLFLAVRGGLDILYRNLGGTAFEDVSEIAGIQGDDGADTYLLAWQAVWHDYDKDGDVDLMAVRDFDSTTRLHENGGQFPFIDVADNANIAFNGYGYSMGVAWGDINGDGWQDAYITRILFGGLYLNDGHGVYSDVAIERGADKNGVSWGVVFSDFENDGDDDLLIVSDRNWGGNESFLLTNQDGFFTDKTSDVGVPFDFFAQGLASGDFNNDGRLDFIIPSVSGDHRLFINETPDAGNWIQVSLEGRRQNTFAIGSRVEVDAGGKTFVRSVSGGDSFSSQSSAVLHFGIGSAELIDELRIYWAGELISVERELAVNQRFEFVEPAVSTGAEPSDALPKQTELNQNYPNPFNPTTLISFEMVAPGNVQLELFDLFGRRIGTILNARKPAGRHVVEFMAGSLASGSYVYTLTTRGRTISRLMTLLK